MQNIEIGIEIEFNFFWSKFHIDEQTYILVISSQFKISQVFLKQELSIICTNVFNKTIAYNWYAIIYIQFLLDLYVALTYSTLYMKKFDKTITIE